LFNIIRCIMKQTSTFFVVLFIIFSFFNSSNATGLLNEDFSYTAGTALTANGWTINSGTGGITVTTSGLSYTGLLGSGIGNAATIGGSPTEDNYRTFTLTSSGTVYASFMIKVSTITSTAGDYFVNFGTATNYYAKIHARKDATSGIDFGITKQANTSVTTAAAPVWSSGQSFGTTHLLVVKYTFNTGSTTNDQVDLFIDPTPGGTEPTATLTTTDGGLTTDATNFGFFQFRQSSSSTTPSATVDGVKVGTTWADVTPASGGIATLTPTGTLSAFSQTSSTPSAEQTYTIVGSNLTNTVTLTPPSGYEISKTTGSGFVNSTGSLSFTAADLLTSKTIYVRLNALSSGTYSGNISHSSSDFSTVNEPVTGTCTIDNGRVLTLTGLVEAYYVKGVTSMTMAPTVTVELHSATLPYGLVESKTGTLSTTGVGTFTFMSAVNGTNYYIVVKSQNTIETWSANAQSFTSNALNYNFTTGLNQAYSDGSNSSLALHNSKYCFYSGDVNQDGFISGDDYTGVDNDNTNFDYHLVNDINGDSFVSGDDFTFIDNNNSLFISKQVPVSTPSPILAATPTSLSSFSYTAGSGPSSSQSYNLSGSNLTGAPGSITVTGSTDYEVSKNNSTWGSSTTISYSSATLSSTPVYVRLKSGLSAGSYNSENISNAGGGATTISVSCSGTVNVVVSNVNLTMGNPSGATTDINNPHNYLLVKPEFCAGYDRDLGTPIWTSWQLNSTWCNGPAVRQDNYIPDPSLPASWNHITGTAFSGSNFARGHMCPSADRLNTQADNDSLFYMTNMDPQNQDNNAGAWEGLETYERTLANAGNVLYIISGRYGSGGKVPTQYSDTTTYYTVNGGKVNVPAKLWKVILVLPAGTNDVSRVTTSTRTIAMIIDNNSVANTPSLWGNYRVSVASIEALTGFNFWSNVSPSILSVIKAGVDNGPTN
jgi:endonuclease G